ncbi:peptidylprolyl isomerase [Nitrosophilus labii]|uniref:peptidylprolyl isomerase n=1 Tax=Nitrosophilus labii TaxID=2706014 RepID=UPI001656D3F4|nr:peptidylprolyl isomerase [Nitrosophilus labii]
MFSRFGKKLKTYNLSKDELQKLQWAKIVIKNKGDIWIKLFPKEVPNTVANFAHLAKEGFYEGLNFHRVIKGFMAQGGCPSGTGTGGPGWAIPCECDKNIHKHKRGAISMAHAGRDTGGSQFFICFVDCPHLDGVHTVFGQIEENDATSFMTLDMIDQGDIIEKIEIFENRE